MLEKLGSSDVRSLEELYALASKCAKMEEGQRAPELAAGAATGGSVNASTREPAETRAPTEPRP